MCVYIGSFESAQALPSVSHLPAVAGHVRNNKVCLYRGNIKTFPLAFTVTENVLLTLLHNYPLTSILFLVFLSH